MKALLAFRPSKRTLLLGLLWVASDLLWTLFDLQSRRIHSTELLMRGVLFLLFGSIVMMLTLVSAVIDTVQNKRNAERTQHANESR